MAVGIVVAAFFGLHRSVDYHAKQAHFHYVEAPSILRHYGDAPIRLLSRDDGSFAIIRMRWEKDGFGP